MSNMSLQLGLKALLSAQAALDTVGHNISNAGTRGYSRQELVLSASNPRLTRGLAIGTGVSPDFVRRSVDALVTRRIVSQTASLQRFQASLEGMGEVESLLGEPGGFGLGGLLDELFSSISRLSTDPASSILRTGVTQSIDALALQFNGLSEELDRTREDASRRIASGVTEVNTLARQIRDLNQEIGKVEAAGVMANDLRDQRELLLTRLAEQVDVSYHETERGGVRVLVGGQLLVGYSVANDLRADALADGSVELFLEGGTQPIRPQGGKLAGLVAVSQGFVPQLGGEVDSLAHNLILEINREHSTGVPASGAFRRLVSDNAVQDQDGDGSLDDEVLGDAGLPFDVVQGALRVNVIDQASGAFETHLIAIDPERTTLKAFLAQIGAIDGLSASLDSSGRVQIFADSDKRFDFARRLDRAPDAAGSFGGGRASLATPGAGPFALSSGDTLDLVGPLGALTVTFDPADFADMSRATASEVAAAINADPGVVSSGLRARAVGERLVLQTQGAGSSAAFEVAGGSALGAFGWSAPALVAGHDTAVQVEIHGSYAGAENELFVFEPTGDGRVGTTPGLFVEVKNAAGQLVATLDVGAGYVPGTELEVADGLRVSFTYGELSATHNDFFVEHLSADADTSDVLVALGLNSMLVGTGAADIGLRADLARDPALLAASASGTQGDVGTLLALLELQSLRVAGLGDSFGGFYSDVVGDVGFRVSAAREAVEVESFLLDSLQSRRAEVSGVNVDEELVDMIQFEQSYGAATQFIQVVRQLGDELLSLI